MNYNTFSRKLRLMDRIREELDEEIWRVFKKYIGDRNIYFNSPNTWELNGDNIFFTGHDGCRGCYDYMSLLIPLKYFEDYDKHTEEELRLVKEKKEEELKRQKELDKQKELRLLEQLKKKYEIK